MIHLVYVRSIQNSPDASGISRPSNISKDSQEGLGLLGGDGSSVSATDHTLATQRSRFSGDPFYM